MLDIAWLTTVRRDAQPQSVPVWFLWDGEERRNIRRNSRVGLNLTCSARGGNVVRVEGTAEIMDGAPPANEVGEYVQKYRESIARIGFAEDGFTRAYSVAIRVMPTRWQIW
jgi:PPOX class probable F420-dependent enzyme